MIDDVTLARYCQKSYGGLTLKAGSTEVLVERRGSAKIIAFRGSNDKRDVLASLSLFPTFSRSCGFTHGGYLECVRGVIFDIMSRIDKDDHLYLTGHSKGGGEALICARMLEAAGYNVVKVMTLGAPKVCVFSARAYRDLNVVQYANPEDPVDNLPLMPWWKHVRKPIKSKGSGHSLEEYLNALAEG